MAQEHVDVLRVLRDEEKIKTALVMNRELFDVIGNRCTRHTNRKLFLAFVNDADSTVRQVLPFQRVELLPSELGSFFGLHGKTAVVD